MRPEAVGLLVGCPRCNSPFVAVEEAALAPVAPPRPVRAEPAREPSRPARSKSRNRAEPVAPADDRTPAKPRRRRSRQPEPAVPHDIPTPEVGLPVSVLVGLALLPFLIPLLWLIAPLVLGHQPVLSLAAPSALAIAAATLCLAVVYTVDWTAATRIKGVLMLVGLSYFAGLSLFYMKKDMLDRVKQFFGGGAEWTEFRPPDGSYQVKLPGKTHIRPAQLQPLPGWNLTCYQARSKSIGRPLVYVVGSGPDVKPLPAGRVEQWFESVGIVLYQAAGVAPPNDEPLAGRRVVNQELSGREWTIRLNGNLRRTIRVYRAGDRVYYQSVEGPNLHAEDDFAQQFFNSFQVK